MTTRSVAAAAGMQPPAIYRLFGDKDGLLDAVAEQGVRECLASKQAIGDSVDPVADLAAFWDLHIRFALAEPACLGDSGHVFAEIGERAAGRFEP